MHAPACAVCVWLGQRGQAALQSARPVKSDMDEVEAEFDCPCQEEEEEDDASTVVSSEFPKKQSSCSKGGSAGGSAPDASASRKDKKESKRRCRLCLKWQMEDQFPVNSAYCRECKQAVDNLAKQAARQKESDWWKKIRNEDAELRKLVSKYTSTCPKMTDKGKRGVFNLVTYRETYTASTSASAKVKGRLMWEEYYVEFAKKPKGGSLSEAAARQKWKDMVADPEVEKDENGPPEAPTRCLVAMFDEVTQGSKLTHGKSQELQSKKDAKNVTMEQASKDRRSIMMGHERGSLNRHGEALDFAGALSGMLANTASGSGGKVAAPGSAFAGKGAFIPYVKVLREELEEDEAEKQPAGAGGSAPGSKDSEAASDPTKKRAGGESPGGDPPPAKKPRWFDAAAARGSVSAKRRAMLQPHITETTL